MFGTQEGFQFGEHTIAVFSYTKLYWHICLFFICYKIKALHTCFFVWYVSHAGTVFSSTIALQTYLFICLIRFLCRSRLWMYCFHQTDCCIYMNTSVISVYSKCIPVFNKSISSQIMQPWNLKDLISKEEKKCIQMDSFVWSYNAMCAISRDPRDPSQNGLYHQHCHCLSPVLCSKKDCFLFLQYIQQRQPAYQKN